LAFSTMFEPLLEACDSTCEIALSTELTPDASPRLSFDTAACTLSLTLRIGDTMILHNQDELVEIGIVTTAARQEPTAAPSLYLERAVVPAPLQVSHRSMAVTHTVSSPRPAGSTATARGLLAIGLPSGSWV